MFKILFYFFDFIIIIFNLFSLPLISINFLKICFISFLKKLFLFFFSIFYTKFLYSLSILLLFLILVYYILFTLKVTSCRPDTIFLKVLKDCASELINILIFVMFFSFGCYQQNVKKTIIKPIYKTVFWRSPDNYCFISILSLTCKTLECFIKLQFFFFLILILSTFLVWFS